MLGKYFRAATSIVYLLLDQFTTAQAAPLTSPRTCEPGPGTLAITDANNVLSIATARLVINGTPAGTTDGLIGTSLARAAGRALIFSVPTAPGAVGNGNNRYGWVSTNAIAGTEAGSLSTQDSTNAWVFDINVNNQATGAWVGVPGVAWEFAVVQRGTGFWAFTRQGSGNWTLQWVGSVGSTTPLYPRVRLNTNACNFTMDDLRVVDLGSPFDTDYGFVSFRTASPTTGATGTMTADAIVEFTWTAAAAETLELDVRRTDASNRWIVRCSQAGGTIKLIERNAGVETERATAAQTFTAGTAYRIVAICSGNSIRGYAGPASNGAQATKWSYTSASFNNTATGTQVAGFATGSNYIAWPRSVTLPSV